MKRIVLIWMAAFLMGGMAMAQHARHSDKMPEPKVRAERAQKKAEMEKKREEMKTARIAYDSQLRKIMTEEQYAAYSKKVQDRKAKMESKRK